MENLTKIEKETFMKKLRSFREENIKKGKVTTLKDTVDFIFDHYLLFGRYDYYICMGLDSDDIREILRVEGNYEEDNTHSEEDNTHSEEDINSYIDDDLNNLGDIDKIIDDISEKVTDIARDYFIEKINSRLDR